MELKPINFLKYFIIHPHSKKLNKVDRSKAMAVSIALGILTLGIVHLVAAVKFHQWKKLPPQKQPPFQNWINGQKAQPAALLAPPRQPILRRGEGVKKGGKVAFDQARERKFIAGSPATEVRMLESRTCEDFKQRSLSDPPAILVRQERKIPPLGMVDTVVYKEGKPVSVHGQGVLFKDAEILERKDIIKTMEIGGIKATCTDHGKWIIQQQATRGCTAATAAMLILDHGKQPDINQLKKRNLGTDEDQKIDLTAAGLKPIEGKATDLTTLREAILAHGTAIVTLDSTIGGHVLLVDDISDDLQKVRVRDPYHGWEITVTQEAFLAQKPQFSSFIQVA